MIGIIDYGMGNLRSVMNAIDYLGFDCALIEEPSRIHECERLILPGVGAYAQAIENLTFRGFIPNLGEHVVRQKPLLGICLGMQLFSTTGNEPYRCEGLDLIAGDVDLMPVGQGTPLPHVGWNSLVLQRTHPLFEGVRNDIDYYFVHSYCFRADRPEDVLGITEYDIPFCSAVARGSVVGLQFHPEKSQVAGLRILKNFCEWEGEC